MSKPVGEPSSPVFSYRCQHQISAANVSPSRQYQMLALGDTNKGLLNISAPCVGTNFFFAPGAVTKCLQKVALPM
jgi:hypothetical protein